MGCRLVYVVPQVLGASRAPIHEGVARLVRDDGRARRGLERTYASVKARRQRLRREGVRDDPSMAHKALTDSQRWPIMNTSVVGTDEG
jgi:hypothetical protein